MNALLYLTTILIWGTTWIAIHFQLGDVPVLVSIFYRFALAAALFLPILHLFGRVQKTTGQDHLFLILQGVCLFSCNFILIYSASQFIASGLVSVIFSLATLYNAFNNRLIWKEAPSSRVYVAGTMGVTGLALLFWQDLAVQASADTLKGILLAAVGTYFFSLGNMISIRNSRKGLKPLTSNAYGMLYGTLILAGVIAVTQTPVSWDTRPIYVGSLLYLAIPGSILGFTVYLTLVGRIGANKAAYTTVLFPVVALTISTWIEHYDWRITSMIGLALVLLGNLVLLGQGVRWPWHKNSARSNHLSGDTQS